MSLYYYLFPVIILLLVVLVVRFLILKKKKSIPVRLFSLALKNENDGRLEEAVTTYKCALVEVKKIRFHSELEKKITDKLKILNRMIEYDRNCHFVR